MKRTLEQAADHSPSNAGILRSFIILMLGMFFIASCLAAYFWLWHPKPPVLGSSTPARVAMLKSAWANGDVIAIIRHAERCDQSSAPCLAAPDGITVRGNGEAVLLGYRYRALGVEAADIYNSPLTRTTQTAFALFSGKSLNQEWLASCERSMLADTTQHKRAHHNLILVTHSGCMKRLERALGFDGSDKPGYISTLFLTLDATDKTPKILGSMNASKFQAIIFSDPH